MLAISHYAQQNDWHETSQIHTTTCEESNSPPSHGHGLFERDDGS